MSWLLGDIGRDLKTREPPLVGKGGLVLTRWTCLSLVVIQPILESNEWIRRSAESAYDTFHLKKVDVQKVIRAFNEALWLLSLSSSGLRSGESRIKEQV
jgi:hypothetical protein